MRRQIIIWLLFTFCLPLTLRAQLTVYPLNHPAPKNKTIHSKVADTPLSLPFWEDFSTSSDRPDTTLWQNSENVWINNGMSFLPPSINVATFDGLDALGQPYGSGRNGLVDSLTSRDIDLGAYSFADDIYMSFFYQAGGLGDVPDDGDDSLRLEFLNNTGEWVPVWPLNGFINDGEFHQVLIPIIEDEFLHENFRFRFQSIGNLTGMFDIWNLDYIYINRNRSVNDTSYPDRTINEPLTSFLSNYYIIPYNHYSAMENREPEFWIRNMVTGPFQQNKAYKYFFNYSIDVTDTLGNTTNFEKSVFVEPIESPIGIGDTELVTVREPIEDFSSIEAADSARVGIVIILDGEDNKPISEAGDYDPSRYAPIDFRSNDTLRMEYLLTDAYAYDDGSAEAAAGLNFAGDFLAVRFDLLADSARITAVDMYFPYIGSEPAGKSIDVIIWEDENGLPGEILHREQFIVQRLAGLNQYIRYQLNRSVEVRGSYFAGYRQNTNGELGLGLDLNTFSGDRMYFNLDDLWEVNSLVTGSLMLRTVFGEVNDDQIVSNDEMLREQPVVWPNPSVSGIFTVNGSIESWEVSDLSGRIIAHDQVNREVQSLRIDLRGSPRGIYILRIRRTNGIPYTAKLIRN